VCADQKSAEIVFLPQKLKLLCEKIFNLLRMLICNPEQYFNTYLKKNLSWSGNRYFTVNIVFLLEIFLKS